jgi:hypothetical protein
MKRTALLFIVLSLSPLFAYGSVASTFHGVPWSGSQDDFKRAIPGLACAPLGCHASFNVGDVPTKLQLTWGGGNPHMTVLSMEFSQKYFADMKRVLKEKYGAATRTYTEDGLLVTQWKFPEVTIDLTPADQDYGATVAFNVNAAWRELNDARAAEKKREAEKHKKAMSDAAKAF